MLSGLELAFAIVPLVISATEHHQNLCHKAHTILSSKARDEQLEDFLSDLHDEIALLGHTLKLLISDLTTLTEEQRDRLLRIDREQWRAKDVNAALRARLGNDAENVFTDILDRLLKALDDVVSEKSMCFVRYDKVRNGDFL